MNGYEEARRHRFDFTWLVEGRPIDHTTFSKFRTRFRGPLHQINRPQARGIELSIPERLGRHFVSGPHGDVDHQPKGHGVGDQAGTAGAYQRQR